MNAAVHITHESFKKIGGIGSVINGLCTSTPYRRFFKKTLLYGPRFGPPAEIFPGFQKEGEILFSTHRQSNPEKLEKIFRPIAMAYNIDITYGRRRLINEYNPDRTDLVDVVLAGVENMHHSAVELFKYRLWEEFKLHSEIYEGEWDYEQYLRIAIPLPEIITAVYGDISRFYLFSHEYMGIPSCLASLMGEKGHATIFVAHEVSTARVLSESLPGHEISFYNIMRKAPQKKSLEEVFGSQRHNPRNELVKLAGLFDRVFAVGDLVRDEYLFLVPDAPPSKIKIVYNGVSSQKLNSQRREEGRRRIQGYVRNLFNFNPDVIFTHITRLIISKGLWRDITFLHFLDDIFNSEKITGAYILLSTLIATGRTPEDIRRMESDWGWPLNHKSGWPDLVGAENDIYNFLHLFNARSRAIKGVFLNQFGFNRELCGGRVPEGAELIDLRLASDAELGFSVYEPFGIAQIETIPFGGLSLLSSTCGSSFLLEKIFAGANLKPFHIADFIGPAGNYGLEQLMRMDAKKRDLIELETLSAFTRRAFDLLPLSRKEREAFLKNARDYSDRLDWDNMAGEYFIPNLP